MTNKHDEETWTGAMDSAERAGDTNQDAARSASPRQKKRDGGPAFPAMEFFDEKLIGSSGGMTLRDYVATHAMVAMINRLGPIVKVEGTGSLAIMPDNPAVSEEAGVEIRAAIAATSYEWADAMLKERAK